VEKLGGPNYVHVVGDVVTQKSRNYRQLFFFTIFPRIASNSTFVVELPSSFLDRLQPLQVNLAPNS